MKNVLTIICCSLVLSATSTLQAESSLIKNSSEKLIRKTLNLSSGLRKDNCSKCEKAAEKAYDLSKRMEDASNFEDLRKNAEEAIEAFDDAKDYAENCGCEKAETEAGRGYKLAKKAYKSENLKEAQEYAKEARKSADDLKSYAGKCSRL